MHLDPHPSLISRPGPLVLCIMDGVGIGDGSEDDAVSSARTPNLDRLQRSAPSRSLLAHGLAVGMPSDSDLGNSEVGHNAMGAGRVFDQGAKLVDQAISSGEAWKTDTWRSLIGGKTLHLIGLVSDGNVHSHFKHLMALINRAVHDGVQRLRVHILTDGRDVPARSTLNWIEPLEAALMATRLDYRVASGGGRMFLTMDRYDADWSMVQRGWDCHVLGKGRAFQSAAEAVRVFYAENTEVDDQYLPAFVIHDDDDHPCGTIHDGDSVLLFNFRGDRAIELSRAFEERSLPQLTRPEPPTVFFAGMMQYDGDLNLPKAFLVAPPVIDRTVGQFLVAAKRRSFACSETQKFGHVTYFYNGNRSGYIDASLERYVQVPSDVIPFEQRPWMKAAQVSDAVEEAILGGEYDFVRLNYPNGDMVGHTGDLEATRIAVEVVDRQLGRLMRAVKAADGVLLITADHGNADVMYQHRKDGTVQRGADQSPLPRTAHTTNPVPFIVYDPRGTLALTEVDDAGIANIGATVLNLLGLETPEGYLPGLVG